jgi:fructokinase
MARRPGPAVVFGVILGTGVGGGIVVNGQVLDGANGIAGEWGHNPLPCRPRRSAPAGLLLRPRRLHRNLSVRPGLAMDRPGGRRG